MPRPAAFFALLASLMLVAASCGSGSDDAATDSATTDAAETTASTAAESAPSTEDETGDDSSSGSGGLSSSSDSGSSGGSSDSSSSSETTTGSSGSTGGLSSEVAAQASLALDDAFPPESEACVLSGLASDDDLLADLLTATDFSELSAADQASVVRIAFDCTEPGVMAEFMVEGFNETSDFPAPEALGTCLEQQMSGADGEQVIIGMIALGEESEVPADARQPLIDTLVECMSGEVMAAAVTESFAGDPTLESAIDIDCVVAGYDSPGAMEEFWSALVDNPDTEFEDLPPEVQATVLSPMLGCVSFGQVVADEAAADGVNLSPDTVACIDDEIEASGLMNDLIAGIEPDENSIVAALFGCLSAEELAQMGG